MKYIVALVFIMQLMSCESGEINKEKKEQIVTSQLEIENEISSLASMSVNDFSEDFLESVINDQSVENHLKIFKQMNLDTLATYLNNDDKRMAFWLNVYNGQSQYLLKKDPSLYLEDRSAFFEKKQIEIGKEKLSMEDIEHGFLRRGATIWTTGFIRIPFRNDLVDLFKVDEVDYRIHFALNCGAESCPAIGVYDEVYIEEQLNTATKRHLTQHVKYNKSENVVFVPAFMKWFKADFGSNKDQREILSKYGLIPNDSKSKIEASEYNWNLKIENYQNFN